MREVMDIGRRTRQMTRIALLADVIVVCSWITVSFVVPFTLQTLGVFLALRFLGGKEGTVCIGVYILLGACGLPVFAGFAGGMSHLLGPTGGYILGFLVSGLIYMALERREGGRLWRLASMELSLFGCYLTGTLWFALRYGASHAVAPGAILMVCVLPFLIPDLVKLILADRLADLLLKWFRSGSAA